MSGNKMLFQILKNGYRSEIAKINKRVKRFQQKKVSCWKNKRYKLYNNKIAALTLIK
jgi:hypothetical protein